MIVRSDERNSVMVRLVLWEYDRNLVMVRMIVRLMMRETVERRVSLLNEGKSNGVRI
jgi:hypothetical protein